MDAELTNELLNDIDFVDNKVKYRKIEEMMPKLMKMVEGEMRSYSQRGYRSVPEEENPREETQGMLVRKNKTTTEIKNYDGDSRNS